MFSSMFILDRALASSCFRFVVLSVTLQFAIFQGRGTCGNNLAGAGDIDFNSQVRPILSSACFTCHGPDESERAAGLRLDTAEGALQDLGGYSAIVSGDSNASELLQRVLSEDPDLRMPPPESGANLTAEQIKVLREWIDQGAEYAEHWAYIAPSRPSPPNVTANGWGENAIDRFILAQLKQHGLQPSPSADRLTLARRLSLDLVGLPPTWEEAERFLNDDRPDAYERYVDALLRKDSFGERWAHVWLDLARYADSAGYADDPPRTIWAYRDYVIRSLNENKPFDQFTIEQIAGDLLPNPSPSELIATAFHRNTLTNNEGGTNDEEFRNVAVVDRVNTTMSVWMGTTMACAQCHTHKYDPLTQEEYFELFAFFNNSQDADRRDESPLHEVWTAAQIETKNDLNREHERLLAQLKVVTPEIAEAQKQWIASLNTDPDWKYLRPAGVASAREVVQVSDDGWVRLEGTEVDTDSVEIRYAIDPLAISGLQLQVPESQNRNFVLSEITARWEPAERNVVDAQFIRVELPGNQKMIHLAEIEVYGGEVNHALAGNATQSSTDFGGNASYVNDGNTDGDFNNRSVTHTAVSDSPWIEIDLTQERGIDRLVLWNRTDGGVGIVDRLKGYQLSLLDAERKVVWSSSPDVVPNPSQDFIIDGTRDLRFSAAFGNHEQTGFPASSTIGKEKVSDSGWAVGPYVGDKHDLTLVFAEPHSLPQGELVIRLEHQSKHAKHLIDHFRIAITDGENLQEWAGVPENLRSILKSGSYETDDNAAEAIADYYLKISPLLAKERMRVDSIEKQLSELKPHTTVPVMRELEDGKRRTTRVQVRGNYLSTEQEVTSGIPSVFHDMPVEEQPTRLDLARWLVDRKNPLTARVIVNRHWEQLMGVGIVATSEEFGSQGDLPTHPKLLDWLAIELMESGWDLKQLIKTIVMSATYQQSSVVTDSLQESDPGNRFYARGPRFRASAEVIRDQALFVSGLLSTKMYGPPVNPPQPQLGLRAAFGSGTDWQTSKGEDRYRRGIYTTWRRSSPYPSMAQFDAPNREVCTVKRIRTNTPLQALVTLNDPVYVEAAQAFARNLLIGSDTTSQRIESAFKAALIRLPKPDEVERIEKLYAEVYKEYEANPESAMKIATDPLGALPADMNVFEAATWTVVANVILNLDETLMKR